MHYGFHYLELTEEDLLEINALEKEHADPLEIVRKFHEKRIRIQKEREQSSGFLLQVIGLLLLASALVFGTLSLNYFQTMEVRMWYQSLPWWGKIVERMPIVLGFFGGLIIAIEGSKIKEGKLRRTQPTWKDND